MQIVVEIIGILAMLTFMFIGIWGFIILNQIYSQLKYKNYLIEKLNHSILLTSKKETDYDYRNEKSEEPQAPIDMSNETEATEELDESLKTTYDA